MSRGVGHREVDGRAAAIDTNPSSVSSPSTARELCSFLADSSVRRPQGCSGREAPPLLRYPARRRCLSLLRPYQAAGPAGPVVSRFSARISKLMGQTSAANCLDKNAGFRYRTRHFIPLLREHQGTF